MEVFCDTWAAYINDLSRLAKELDAAASGRIAAEKQAYQSLPRPGVSSSSDTSSLCDRVHLLNVVDVSGVCESKQSTNSLLDDSSSSSYNASTSPESAKAHISSGYVSADLGSSYTVSAKSAFVPYNRESSSIHLNREQPNAPIIMRQKTDEAPLAKFDDDLLADKSQFETRMSLILDNLNTEVKNCF